MRILFGILLALVVGQASAGVSTGTPQFLWTNPLTWTDGSTLTATQITGYQLNCSGADIVNRRIAVAAGVPPFQTPTAERYTPGLYNCTLAVYAKYTPTSTEVLGASTNPVSFTVPQPTLGAPTGFSVN